MEGYSLITISRYILVLPSVMQVGHTKQDYTGMERDYWYHASTRWNLVDLDARALEKVERICVDSSGVDSAEEDSRGCKDLRYLNHWTVFCVVETDSTSYDTVTNIRSWIDLILVTSIWTPGSDETKQPELESQGEPFHIQRAFSFASTGVASSFHSQTTFRSHLTSNLNS